MLFSSSASAGATAPPEAPESSDLPRLLFPAPELESEAEGLAEESPVPGRYIVVLKDSVDRPGQVASEQVQQRGGKLGFLYRSALEGYSVGQLSHSDVEVLRNDPRVKYVEPDRKIEVSSQTIPTGIGRIFATGNSALDIDGEDDARVNADVAVLDGRIDYTHPDLNVVERIDCVPPGDTGTPECVPDTGNVFAWHATHVAGIIGAIDNGYGVVGAAPGARLWGVRVFDNEGVGMTSWTNAAIDWVTKHAGQVEVANMSLGGAGSSRSQNEAIEAAVEAGVVNVVAAGNQSENSDSRHPANSPGVISVSALADYDGKPGGGAAPTCTSKGADDTEGTFSNWGNGVDLAAPGVCIYSTDVGGGYSYATYGTSFATPYVSGAAAVAASQSNPESRQDVERIRQQLVNGGSLNWTDTSEDGKPEPVLYLGGESITKAEVATGGWSSTDGTSATLSGAVNARGLEAEYQFEYGPTTAYGQSAPSVPAHLSASAWYTPVEQGISGLEPGHTYHYRLTATTSSGKIGGEDHVISTPQILQKSLPPGPEAQSQWFNDLACPEGKACMATAGYYDGANRAGVYRQAGGQWTFSALSPPTGDSALQALGVSCASTSACTAVGRAKAEGHPVPVAERWNGTNWSVESISPPFAGAPYSVLTDVSCATATDCMAVGYYRNLEGVFVDYAAQLKNGSWSSISPPNPTGSTQSILEDVSCVTSTACTAVGWNNTGAGSRPVILTWNGTTWSLKAAARSSGTLYGISCTSASFCVAVGGQLSTEVWNGSSWSSRSAQAPSGSSGGYLEGVSCTAPGSCAAVGAFWKGPRTFSLADSWNGTAWKAEAMPREAEKNSFQAAVSCVALYGCTTVGDNKAAELEPLLSSREDLTTGSTSEVLPGKAVLEGSVNPGGLSATYKFEYGKSPSYGMSVPASGSSVGSGPEAIEVSQEIKELEPETVYHYRLMATNVNRTVYGADLTFTSGTPTHHFVLSVGSPGTGKGQLDAPWGLDVDSEGNLWVADRNNNRVEKFSAAGQFLLMAGREVDKTTHANVCTAASGDECGIGLAGTGNGQFHEPLDVAATATGEVWVTDGANNRVQKLNSKGGYLAQFGSAGTEDGKFTEPWGIDIASNGDIWVSDARFYRIQKFNSSGGFLLRVTGFEGPRGLEVDANDDVWVTERTSNRVQEVAPNGEKLAQFGATGTGDGQFEEPQAVDVQASGDLLVTDRFNDRVQQFTVGGKYLTQFGDNEVIEPRGITDAGEGITYVSNSWRDRIDEWRQNIPRAVTEGATGIGSGDATLSAVVNPREVATQYRFEYGETSAYGTKLSNESAGSGGSDAVKKATIGGLKPSTTYHYRVVATSSEGTVYGKDKTFSTKANVATSLSGMPVVEPFSGSSESLSKFSSKWSALGWAGGSTPKGSDTTTGWRQVDAYPSVGGAYYTQTVSDAGSGGAVAATLTAGPNSASRYFSLWFDASGAAAARSGYELRFVDASSNVYTVTLSKWSSGTQTVLATQSGYSFAVGGSVALVDQGEVVSAWSNSGSGFSQLLSANDTSFSSGNTGIEAAGNTTRMNNFKAGSL